MRLVILKEDYCGALLGITDCSDEELKEILLKVEENDENGIGETVDEICEKLFPIKMFQTLGDTDNIDFRYIVEINTKVVASTNYLGFGVVC